jgi:hypothetical protein
MEHKQIRVGCAGSIHAWLDVNSQQQHTAALPPLLGPQPGAAVSRTACLCGALMQDSAAVEHACPSAVPKPLHKHRHQQRAATAALLLTTNARCRLPSWRAGALAAAPAQQGCRKKNEKDGINDLTSWDLVLVPPCGT